MEQSIKQRQIAYKISLSDIHTNDFIKQEGWEPNYIMCGDKKISRVNLIGTVISPINSEQNYLVIDDGKSNIVLRQFENKEMDLMDYDIGNVINVIGKIREFNNERYILPEIIKRVSPKWLLVRKKEIECLYNEGFYKLKNVKEALIKPTSTTAEKMEHTSPKDGEEILQKIRELDSGDGANIETIIQNYGSDSEKIIKTLLEQGDIFTTKPGKVKVLE